VAIALASHIQKILSLQLFGTASTFPTTVELVRKHEIEMLFVCNKIADHHLPLLSSIRVHLIMLCEIEFIVPEALTRQRSVNWLDKPLSASSLANAYHKILEYEHSRKTDHTLATSSTDFIFIKTEYKGKLVKVLTKDICYVEGFGNYLTIHTTDCNRLIAYATFNEIINILPANFIRVHKSFLVSIDHIGLIDGNQLRIVNRTEPIPLGHSFKEGLFEAVGTKIVGGKSKTKVNSK